VTFEEAFVNRERTLFDYPRPRPTAPATVPLRPESSGRQNGIIPVWPQAPSSGFGPGPGQHRLHPRQDPAPRPKYASRDVCGVLEDCGLNRPPAALSPSARACHRTEARRAETRLPRGHSVPSLRIGRDHPLPDAGIRKGMVAFAPPNRAESPASCDASSASGICTVLPFGAASQAAAPIRGAHPSD